MSALKLYLAMASPISPGWTGGGGLAGCAFSGGVSFCNGEQLLVLRLVMTLEQHPSGGEEKGRTSTYEIGKMPTLP